MKHLVLLFPTVLLVGCGQSPMTSTSTQTGNAAQAASAQGSPKAPPKSQQVEAGRVAWLRNLDEAKKVAGQTNKPILLLFQEIPG